MGVVCYQRRSGKPGQRSGSLRHRKSDHRPRRRQAFRAEQIHGAQGPVGASAAVRPHALRAGQGHPGREQVPAPHPRRPGHTPEIQGPVSRPTPRGPTSPGCAASSPPAARTHPPLPMSLRDQSADWSHPKGTRSASLHRVAIRPPRPTEEDCRVGLRPPRNDMSGGHQKTHPGDLRPRGARICSASQLSVRCRHSSSCSSSNFSFLFSSTSVS